MTAAATKPVLNYGDDTTGYYVLPHPTKRGEYVAEARPAKVTGFSHPSLRDRDWGWRGSVLVKFEDGHQSWQSY